MPRETIFLTGATDGIGLETAKMLATEGHTILLHGRNSPKLKVAEAALAQITIRHSARGSAL